VEKLDYLLTGAEEGERAIKIAARESEHLEQSILGYAFRGRLAPQDPSDEPASALLEKIKSQRAVLTGKGKPQALLELVSPAKITSKA
jgi:type I restriction enzyme S subunit